MELPDPVPYAVPGFIALVLVEMVSVPVAGPGVTQLTLNVTGAVCPAVTAIGR